MSHSWSGSFRDGFPMRGVPKFAHPGPFLSYIPYPLVNIQKTIENGHRNSEFPMRNGGSFHRFLNIYQRLYPLVGFRSPKFQSPSAQTPWDPENQKESIQATNMAGLMLVGGMFIHLLVLNVGNGWVAGGCWDDDITIVMTGIIPRNFLRKEHQ